MNKILIALLYLFALPIFAAEPVSLQALLEQIKKERLADKKQFVERELKFKSSRDQQKELLTEAIAELEKKEQHNASLQQQYDEHEAEINRRKKLLEEKTGTLNELDGIVKQIAGELNAIIDTSLVSAQKIDRGQILDTLTGREEFPSLQELEELWILTIDEMVESGKIATFPARIITAEGNEVEREATRVGVFNAISNGRFVKILPHTKKLMEPARQPGRHYLEMAKNLETAAAGMHAFPIDPTRGAMLALLVQTPDLKTRIEQGGFIGYVILFIGLISLFITFERFIFLTRIGRDIRAQLNSTQAGDNPLGRIMRVYGDNAGVDTETLSLRLDEAIIKEIPRIQRGLSTLGLFAAIAPLLGLLGTVTGIIETFQSITLYGTSDPRVMSGGISQALVTTVMGLVVAIPLLLFHSLLSSKSNTLIRILDEKSTAFTALLSEETNLSRPSIAVSDA